MLANSEDPDLTPRSAASDLGLHCLPRSQKWEARLIWVKINITLKSKQRDVILDSMEFNVGRIFSAFRKMSNK